MSETFKELKRRERANVKETRNKFRKEIRFYIKCVELLDEISNEVFLSLARSEKAIGLRDLTAIAISKRFVCSSKVTLDLFSKCYFYDLYILYRSMSEEMYLFNYLMDDEKNFEKWKNEGDKFRWAEVKKTLGLADEFYKYWYGGNSSYVHSNIDAVIDFITKPKDESEPIELNSLFCEPSFREGYIHKYVLFPLNPIGAILTLRKHFGSLLSYKTIVKIAKMEKMWISEMQEIISEGPKE